MDLLAFLGGDDGEWRGELIRDREEERIRRKGIREMDMMDGDGEKRTLICFYAVVVFHAIFAQHISPCFREEA